MTTPNKNGQLYVPGRLDGKVALVTGSGRGIGAAIAIHLGRLGAKVVVNYANAEGPAAKVVEAIKSLGSDAIALKADIRQVPQTADLFDRAVAHFGKLDIAVSNSGVVSFGHLKDVTEEEFDRVFSLNTRGQYFVAREAYRVLSQGGRIIMTSSNTSFDFSVPKHSIYSASKAAIDSFVRILARDCGDKGITVNAVAPGKWQIDHSSDLMVLTVTSGGTVTDMFHDVSVHYIPNGEAYTGEQRQKMAAMASPLGRNGYPEDVAYVVGFLASKEGEWINGKSITLDGGAK